MFCVQAKMAEIQFAAPLVVHLGPGCKLANFRDLFQTLCIQRNSLCYICQVRTVDDNNTLGFVFIWLECTTV